MDGFGLFFLLFLAAYAACQWWLLRLARRQEGRPVPPVDDLLGAGFLNRPRLILYFWHPGCHLCGPTDRLVGPLLATRRDIIRINTLEDRELVRRFDVTGAPTLMVLRDGLVERVLVGSRDEERIRQLLGVGADAEEADD